MKKYILMLAAASLLLMSCKDMLNLSPNAQIAEENMWTTEDLADQGIIGLYRIFTKSSGTTFVNGSNVGIIRQYWGALEFQGVWFGTGTDILNYSGNQADAYIIQYEWRWCYAGIGRCNDAIANLHKAGLSDEKFGRYMCEARCMRAWFYSRLNQIFQGVPIYLEPVSNEDCTKTQSTAAEVWDAVMDDLNYCIDNVYFPNNTLTTNYGRLSKGAAYAIRGTAYMWMAWSNNDDSSYYQLAADDFEKVAECGYGLFDGNQIDFFTTTNEKTKEMIFPVQFDGNTDYCDNLQYFLGCSDCYGGTAYWRASPAFVDYFQNADGSEFDWAERIPEWNDDVFVNDPVKREVFFLRDSICVTNWTTGEVSPDYIPESLGTTGETVTDYWMVSASSLGIIQEELLRIGMDIVQKYYCKDGNGNYVSNEERIRSAYNNRDPRLKDIILVPYDPWDVYASGRNGGEDAYNKEARWPVCRDTGTHGGDIYIGGESIRQSVYMYRKYVRHKSGEIPRNSATACDTDWPVIRYTDIYLHLAECYAHLGQYSKVQSIVNEVRSRSGASTVSLSGYNDSLEAVKYERRVELCIEGYDWFDEWRWGDYQKMKFKGLTYYGAATWWDEWESQSEKWYYNDNKYPFAAPSSECVKNTNLQRREGWAY